MKLGIVGSGIAGLTAAWLFHRAGHRVTLFENQSAIGMDCHAVEVHDTGGRFRGDVPSRMFNEIQWPNLARLYREIGVQIQEVDASQSIGVLGEKPFLNFGIAFRPELSAILRVNSRVRKIMSDIRRLRTEGTRDLASGLSPEITLGEYLRRGKFSHELICDFLYPTLSSTICTCSYAALNAYPAKIVLETLRKLSDQKPLMRTTQGTTDVAARLTSGIDDIRLGCHVNSVRQRDDGVDVLFNDSTATATETFEHFIVATQANQALKVLSSPTRQEQTMLECFSYEPVSVIVHTDARLMPVDRRRWATFNMIIGDPSASMCSVWMNRFHTEWQAEKTVFQTINPVIQPHADSILVKKTLQRPVVDQKSLTGWSMLDRLHCQLDRRVWFCGSYASYGLPLLESGVVSSLKVAKALHVGNSIVA